MTKTISIISKKKYSNYSQNVLAKITGSGCFNKDYLPLLASDIYINWGNTTIHGGLLNRNILNRPSAVSLASNKLLFLRKMSSLLKGKIIDWTESKQIAESWLSEGFWVVSRKLLRASNGRGALIHKKGDELPLAPLYTKYFKKKHEYRFHIFSGKLIHVQKKKRLSSESLIARGFPERPSSYIRNLDNGYIYTVEDLHDPIVAESCIDCLEVLGLDFGAVDVLVAENQSSFKICEVNTAPGLTGSTLDAYKEAILSLKGDSQ